MSPQQWQQTYTIKCTVLQSKYNGDNLLQDCLQIMKDICDINDRTKFSSIRFKASYFVAMITWELGSNHDFLTHSMSSDTYKHLVKLTMALAFYDNNSYYADSPDTERFIKVQWLTHAMEFVLDHSDSLASSKKTDPIVALQPNESLLTREISNLDNSTAPFVEAILCPSFNWTVTRDKCGMIYIKQDAQIKESLYQRSLKPPTSEHAVHKNARESILRMLRNDRTSFENKITFYHNMTKYMMYKPLVEVKDDANTTVVVDLQQDNQKEESKASLPLLVLVSGERKWWE